jgi:hypothetical protein
MRAASGTALWARWPVLCFLTILALPSAAIAAEKTQLEPPLTLEVQPTELSLDMGRPRGQLLVLARNPKAATIRSAELHFIPVLGLTTTIVQKPTTPWAGDLVWIVEVTGAEAASSPARLVTQLTYTASGHNVPTRTTAATVTVTAPPPMSVTALKTTLLPPDGLVDEETPLDLMLTIDNPTRQTAQVKDIVLLAPAKYVQFDPKRLPHSPGEVAPGGSLAIPLRLVVGAAVPGTYTLVIGFNVAFSNRPAEWLPTTAQSKVSIEVRGVSDALQFLNVGSLLLLPGVLTILTFITFFSWFAGRAPIDWKNPFLLVVSVMLSFCAAKTYPWITARWLGQSRDYLRAYQMQDVVNVWVGSVTIGGGVGIVAGLAVSGLQWWDRTWQPQLTDRPIDILRKLGCYGADFWLPAVQRNPNGDAAAAQLMLVLPFGRADPGRHWVVQRTRLGQGNGDGAAGRMAVITGLLNGEHGAASQTRRLVKEVSAGLRVQQVTLEWEREPNVGPVEVADADHPHGAGARTFLVLP